MNKNTLRSSNSKATTNLLDLYTDGFVSILSFGEPLEMWEQRLTCSRWRETVSVARLRVTAYSFDIESPSLLDEKGRQEEEYESRRVRQVVDLCPNLTVVDSGESREQVNTILSCEKSF